MPGTDSDVKNVATGPPGEPAPGGNWRLVSGPHRDHHPSLLEYVSSETLASRYDAHFSETELFEYDQEFLNEVLPAQGRMPLLGRVQTEQHRQGQEANQQTRNGDGGVFQGVVDDQVRQMGLAQSLEETLGIQLLLAPDGLGGIEPRRT